MMLNISNTITTSMSHKETSAWITLIALGIAAFSYFSFVWSQSSGLSALIAPSFPALLKYSITLIVLLVGLHILSAIVYAKEADQPMDEREKQIEIKASHHAGVVLGVLVVAAMVQYLSTHIDNGNFLFYAVLASLVISQLFESLLTVFYHRRGI